jgi:hypothetical protein
VAGVLAVAAVMRRGRRRTSSNPNPISNSYVEDTGRRYRICRYNGRVTMVMLKCRAGGERALDIHGRRARYLVRREQETQT